MYAHTQTVLPRDWGRRIVQKSNHCHFHCAPGFATPVLAHMLDSLVRVSRRGKENHFDKLIHKRRQQPESTPLAPIRHSQTKLTNPATAPCTQANTEVWRGWHWFPSLPFQQFQVLFNSLFKVLCIFPSRYLYAIGLPPIFSFRWNLPPALSCNPKQLDSIIPTQSPGKRGSHPLCRPVPRDLARTLMWAHHNSAQAQIHKWSYSRFSRPYWGNPG